MAAPCWVARAPGRGGRGRDLRHQGGQHAEGQVREAYQGTPCARGRGRSLLDVRKTFLRTQSLQREIQRILETYRVTTASSAFLWIACFETTPRREFSVLTVLFLFIPLYFISGSINQCLRVRDDSGSLKERHLSVSYIVKSWSESGKKITSILAPGGKINRPT